MDTGCLHRLLSPKYAESTPARLIHLLCSAPRRPRRNDRRCDTLEPVSTYATRSLAAVDPEESAPTVARSLQKWKENEKWRETEKWKGLEKWRRNYGTEVVHM